MTSIPATQTAISALRLEERVERDVKAGIPEIDRNNHTESEESLRSYVMREIIGKVHQGRQEQLDEEVEARNDVGIRQLYQDIKNTESAICKRIESRFAVIAQDLKRAAKELSSVRTDLEIFRHRNGLTRDAIYRESKILHYSVIFFIVIFETALNSFFLSKGSELGLVGGFFQAFIISLVNLGLAAFAAVALRNTFHRNIARKLSALLVFAAIGAIATAFVLGVGHYREALEVNPFIASKLAVLNLLGDPFGIHDFNSWIMVIVSAIALILLTAKFFVVDDRYPGYTAMTRRLTKLQDQWARSCAVAIDEINEVAEVSQQELSDKEREIRTQYIGFKSSIEHSEEIRRHYEEDIVKAQGLLDELVRYYQSYSARMMNRRAAYFGELLRFELDKLPTLNTTGLEQHKVDLTAFDLVLKDLDQAYADSIAAINSKCRETQRELAGLISTIERDNGLSGM
ncbi:hypothetical protein SAMN04487965_1188 [Microbulbifer donghaiensis]|uniref:Uncharacterized protein n=1 Tax=Microbulbifer donghaiensis TaxID=494016 RepID=A0A1M4Y8P2_9GAMM|nr:hypothetical protein [Microbulbifer donghaiensis]SHF02197.1 hypothetical protein SAMN04487965_1188 [Microbulbifer donghaiensis]